MMNIYMKPPIPRNALERKDDEGDQRSGCCGYGIHLFHRISAPMPCKGVGRENVMILAGELLEFMRFIICTNAIFVIGRMTHFQMGHWPVSDGISLLLRDRILSRFSVAVCPVPF